MSVAPALVSTAGRIASASRFPGLDDEPTADGAGADELVDAGVEDPLLAAIGRSSRDRRAIVILAGGTDIEIDIEAAGA